MIFSGRWQASPVVVSGEGGDALKPGVSLVMTVRNEGDSIRRLLDSICQQTLPPAEVVIVDGGSTDNTAQIVGEYMAAQPIRLLERPGANISQGRNEAIRAAKCDLIAVTDAGTRLDPRWLEELTRPLLEDAGAVDVVPGFFIPDPQTPFERAMGATVLPAVEDVDPERFLPSSRSVAFRREAWEKSGGYPEWLDYCEDLVFDIRLRDLGFRFAFAPGAKVYFRPRSNLRAFFVQYYRYARGDGKADLWRKRHAIRYFAYILGPTLFLWALKRRETAPGKLELVLILLAAGAYCRRPYARLLPLLAGLSLSSKLQALSLVPLIRVTGDIAKMFGYPVGVLWRLRRGR